MDAIQPVVFDPSKVTLTIDGVYLTGLGESPITFDYSNDSVTLSTGLDGASVFAVNAAKNGTCTLPVKISCPQYARLVELAKNHTLFPIWCTDKSTGRRAGGNYAMFSKIPGFTGDASDISLSICIADMDIDMI